MNENGDKMTERTLLYTLGTTSKIAQLFAVRFFNQHKTADITFNQFEILSALNEKEYYQRDLAKFLFKSNANLSKDLDVLEEKELIIRKTSTKNKRMVKILYLTDKGKHTIIKIDKIAENYINEVENIYTKEELVEFEKYLNRLKDKLSNIVDRI